MTLEQIIKRALRSLGAIRAGGTPTTQQYNDALESLQLMLINMPSTAWIDVDTASDYTAAENERVRITSGAPTISRPTTVEDPYAENGERAPYEGSRIQIVSAAGVATTWRYSAVKGQWVSLDNLTTASANPLGRWDDGLAAALAVEIAPEYDVQPSPLVMLKAARFRYAAQSRPEDAGELVTAVYY